MVKVIDTFVLYKILRRLSTPIENWEAFKVGLIDKHGNFLVAKKDRNEKQANALSYFDILILNLKKVIAKAPYGESRLVSLAAAMYFLREDKQGIREEMNLSVQDLHEYMDEAKSLLEDGAAASGGGAVAGGSPSMNKVGTGAIADPKTSRLGKRVIKRIKLTSKKE